MGMDPRSMSGSELHMAMNQVRTGIDAPDYFHHPGRTPYPRYDGGMAPTTTYPGDFETDRPMAPYDLEMGSSELNHRYRVFMLLLTRASLYTVSYQHQRDQSCGTARQQSSFLLRQIRQTIP